MATPPSPLRGRGRALAMAMQKKGSSPSVASVGSSSESSFVAARPVPEGKPIEPKPAGVAGGGQVPPAAGRGRAILLARLAASSDSRKPSGDAPPAGPGPSGLASGLETVRIAPVRSGAQASGSGTPLGVGVRASAMISTPKPEPKVPPPPPVGSALVSSGPTLYRGTEGKPLKVTANYLRLEVEEGRGVFEHEVLFDPGVDSRDERFKLLNQQRQAIGHVRVFDGSKLFLPGKIDGHRKDLVSIHSSTGHDVKVSVVFKRQRGPEERDIIYLYNNLFGKIMRTLKLVQHNRNYFNPHAAHLIPAYNLEVWPGYVTAVDMYEGGLLLQCDVAHRVLRTETVLNLLATIHQKAGANNMRVEAEKQLLGTSVMTRYNNKSYIIDDLDFESSPKSTFVNEKGEAICFMDYYEANYGIKIKDPNQPMIVHRARKKHASEAGVEKVLCLVPELCILTGLTDSMRADFKIMKELATYTKCSPAQRQVALQSFVRDVMTCPEAKAHLTDWGLKLAPQTMPLEARQIQPELLFFGRNFQETVGAKADWTRTATSKPVLTAVPLSKWAVVYSKNNEQAVRFFCNTMAQQAPRMGIQMAMPKPVALPNDRTETYLKGVRDVIDPTTQLVLVVFPQMRTDRYSAIKKLCCVERPIASQVVNFRTINNDRKVVSVAQKVALQINCKLGGELWGCRTPHKDLMVVGIDVFHDKAKKSSSVAGVVTSMNDSFSRYYSTVVTQQEGQELVDALKVAFMQGLVKYWEANHRWPQHIVVFRDGVGDGQLETVAKYECDQFIGSFRHVGGNGNGNGNGNGTGMKLPSGYNPGFTFVVVQKRIHTRIYSLVPGGRQMGFENPPCGTVVDHTVTRHGYKDFFLVSQSVTQGTVSPTHFIVVRELGDELAAGACAAPVSCFTATDVQKLAYKLTHMYFNWPGTVKVPAPVQYAHKLADLVGQYVHKSPNPGLNDKLYYL